jgi:hypothetical protein
MTPDTASRLLVVVRLSSERVRQPVRQDCSFAMKQASPPALLVVVRGERLDRRSEFARSGPEARVLVSSTNGTLTCRRAPPKPFGVGSERSQVPTSHPRRHPRVTALNTPSARESVWASQFASCLDRLDLDAASTLHTVGRQHAEHNERTFRCQRVSAQASRFKRRGFRSHSASWRCSAASTSRSRAEAFSPCSVPTGRARPRS